MPHEQTVVKRHGEALRRAPRKRFPPSREPLDCPSCQGVYLIFDPQGRVAHVGRTTRAKAGLSQRLKAHLAGRSSFVIKYLRNDRSKLRRGYSYAFIEVSPPRIRALVEAYLTGVLCPQHIGTGESAVYNEELNLTALAWEAGWRAERASHDVAKRRRLAPAR